MLIAVLIAGCSDGDTVDRERSREFVEGTLSSPATSARTTEVTGITGGTVSNPNVSLRLEGDPQTTFSGICTVGTEESVISGQVPKLYRFELNGREFSCRIQKRNPEGGSLRVVLLAGDSTRSVQQTQSRNSIIRLSYAEN